MSYNTNPSRRVTAQKEEHVSKYAYLRLCTNGEIKVISASDNGEFTLQELQQNVSGGIEIVKCRFGKNLSLVVNDEGAIKHLPLNPYASLLYQGILSDALIFGDAVLCISKMDPEPDVYPMQREFAELLRQTLIWGSIITLNEMEWR